MANNNHIDILFKGAKEWNNWRKTNPKVSPDLSNYKFNGIDLTEYELKNVKFNGSNLFKCILKGCDLSGSTLKNVFFFDVVLENAVIANSSLKNAKIINSNLWKADLHCSELIGVNFNRSILIEADFSDSFWQYCSARNAAMESVCLGDAFIFDSDFTNSNLTLGNLIRVHLKDDSFIGVKFNFSNIFNSKISECEIQNSDFTRANISYSSFYFTSLNNSKMIETICVGADFTNSDLSFVDLTDSDLSRCIFNETILTDGKINNSKVYGVSVWDTQCQRLVQNNLIITKQGEAVITVDNLEVAQFIYLLLNKEKIRDAIGTISKKGVLILGRFTPERKKILDAIREKLREHDFVPMMFDFEKVSSRDLTETIKVLAGLSKFIIADISEPSSIPLELQATVPDYGIPFLPIIQNGLRPFAMFIDLQQKYQSVSDLLYYENEHELISSFEKSIIERANQLSDKLINLKASSLKIVNAKDFV